MRSNSTIYIYCDVLNYSNDFARAVGRYATAHIWAYKKKRRVVARQIWETCNRNDVSSSWQGDKVNFPTRRSLEPICRVQMTQRLDAVRSTAFAQKSLWYQCVSITLSIIAHRQRLNVLIFISLRSHADHEELLLLSLRSLSVLPPLLTLITRLYGVSCALSASSQKTRAMAVA